MKELDWCFSMWCSWPLSVDPFRLLMEFRFIAVLPGGEALVPNGTTGQQRAHHHVGGIKNHKYVVFVVAVVVVAVVVAVVVVGGGGGVCLQSRRFCCHTHCMHSR